MRIKGQNEKKSLISHSCILLNQVHVLRTFCALKVWLATKPCHEHTVIFQFQVIVRLRLQREGQIIQEVVPMCVWESKMYHQKCLEIFLNLINMNPLSETVASYTIELVVCILQGTLASYLIYIMRTCSSKYSQGSELHRFQSMFYLVEQEGKPFLVLGILFASYSWLH